jgi:D-glycero-alpha-D-manno-heptose-7-phosphate kinase
MFRLDKNFLVFKKNEKLKNILTKIKKFIFKNNRPIIFVVDDKNKCVGTVTDGDIRRFIEKNLNLNTYIYNISRKDFVYVYYDDPENKILRAFEKLNNKRGKYLAIPVLKKNHQIEGILDYEDYISSFFIKRKIIRARIPARVSFSGGGTDFSDIFTNNESQVLSSTINKFSTISLLLRSDNKVNIINRSMKSSIKINHFNQIEKVKGGLILECLRLLKPKFGFDLEILSDFESGTGLGGSSSIAVAILAVFNELESNNKMDLNLICNLAYQAERINLGIKGGWQDFFSTAYGGFNWIELDNKDIIVNPLRIPEETINELEHNLMLFRIGKTRSSSLIQKKIIKKNYKKSNFIKIKEISKEMKKCLLRGKVKQFGDLLDISWVLKKKFSPFSSNKKIDKIYEVIKKNGALGGKLLGAGQSGYLLVYSSPTYQGKIKNELKKLGAKFENLRFVNSGLKTWTTER